MLSYQPYSAITTPGGCQVRSVSKAPLGIRPVQAQGQGEGPWGAGSQLASLSRRPVTRAEVQGQRAIGIINQLVAGLTVSLLSGLG